MAGNITRLPLSSITFGRPWCWPSHVPQTRLICDRTQALELARFFWELPQDQSSGLNPNCSAHWCWSGCVSRWTSQSRNVSVDVSLTQLEGTGQLAQDLADSAQEQSVPKGLWPECVGK